MAKYEKVLFVTPAHTKATTHFVESVGTDTILAICGKSIRSTSGTDESLSLLLSTPNRICTYCLGKAEHDLRPFLTRT
eukprot:1404810-Karenia_brevis.AAC.1